MAKFRVIYDREACIGAAACAAAAPKFWVMNEDGKADLISSSYNADTKKFELVIEDATYLENKDAADVCPVEAIKVIKIEEVPGEGNKEQKKEEPQA